MRLRLQMQNPDTTARNHGLMQGGYLQKVMDSTCLKYMTPYTPMRLGNLMRSGRLSTVIGSGEIAYKTPYARYQYYGVVYGPNVPLYDSAGEVSGWWSPPRKHPTNRTLNYARDKHPEAQRLWFEVMKRRHLKEIYATVNRAKRGGHA